MCMPFRLMERICPFGRIFAEPPPRRDTCLPGAGRLKPLAAPLFPPLPILPPAILLFEELPGLPVEPFPFLPIVPVPVLPVVPGRVVPGLTPLVEVWVVFPVGLPFVCAEVVGLPVEGRDVFVCGAAGFGGGADCVFGFCWAVTTPMVEPASSRRTSDPCGIFLLCLLLFFETILIANS